MDSQRDNRSRSRLAGRGALADGDGAPTGGGDRTSRFQAASYPLLTVFQTSPKFPTDLTLRVPDLGGAAWALGEGLNAALVISDGA